MKIKLIQLSLITSLALSLNASTIESVNNWNTYPLPQEVTSKSRGGTLVDKEAMKDGVGSIVVKSINGNTSTLNNEQYNKLLLLNKDKLTDTVGLKELIANGDIVVDSSILNSINGNGLSNPTGLPVDGSSCNDNNSLTTNDIYTNNVCLGTSIVGTSCDDNNADTENDVYDTNGVCIGTPFVLSCTSSKFTNINPQNSNINKYSPIIINSSLTYYGSVNGLFDGVRDGSYNNGAAYFWYTTDYVELKFDKPVRIWRSGTSSYYYYSAQLSINKKNDNGTYTNLGNTIKSEVNQYNYALMTNCLEAGTYKFKTITQKETIDSEWFVEAAILQ